ncbi:hypothetical protein Q5424_19740 [Conexibacter sp. JD483]|uniref:hypothetical protein n=1 Tax=unclassified Conexibacter TaxID=2627773 RepID=UPI00271E2423|nr:MULTISPECIES: hypothetical protein [unclassified Conexibacter]MDO8188812.1 hypothetical protein [Conexibacter sp. CPCC 205706]MDO8201657.1 hypothetical protein [Conexibacter sp. CPCC 205762]MDR9371341.1 hypothetical protein [Conexibacter sp. JD483]
MATFAPTSTDATRELLSAVWCLVAEGRGLVDDVAGTPIRGIEHYADLLDLERPQLLSLLPQRNALPETDRDGDLEADLRAWLGHEPAGLDRVAARERERRIKAAGLIAQHLAATHGGAAAVAQAA